MKKIEVFNGILLKVDHENIAYFDLVSENGEKFWCEDNYEDMKKAGIQERRRFTLTIIEKEDGEVECKYESIPDEEVNYEEIDKLLESLDI